MVKTLLTVGMTVLSLSISIDRASAMAFGHFTGVRSAAHQVLGKQRIVNRFSFTWKRASFGNGGRNRINGQHRIHNQNRVYQQNGGTKQSGSTNQSSSTSNLPNLDSILSGSRVRF